MRPFRPSRILDQHFGLGLHPEDLMVPFDIPQTARAMLRCPTGYYRPWRSQAGEKDTGSVVTFDKDKFQVNLDVQHFAPEEITVKITGKNAITVEDGVLTITAPKISDKPSLENRTIPIQQTGVPSKSVEPAKTEDKQI
ncbi:hypothetical protein Trydic_g9165 [Trypoxylus dichotomus]